MNPACALAAALLVAPAAAAQDAAGTAIEGVVLDGDGQPVFGARLALLRSAEGTFDVFDAPFPDGTVRSDSRGRFALRAAPGHLAVVASRVGAASIALRLVPVTVTAAGTARVVVRFDGTASIRGRAIDETGRPVAMVRVTAIPERTGPAARGDAIIVRAWTAEDGTFLLDGLVTGAHRLLARGRGHNCVEACEYGRGMRVGTGPSPVNVPLTPTGSVSGRVVHRDGEGRLVPVQAFEIYSPAFGTVRVGPEDEGRFDVDVPRLWSGAALFVEAPGLAPFATKFDLTKPVAVDLGEVLLGPGRTVRGRVRDQSGAAIEGALVRVGFGKSALDAPSATSDAAGAFEIAGISEGPAPLAVTHPRFRPQDVVAAAGAPEIEVRLTPGIGWPCASRTWMGPRWPVRGCGTSSRAPSAAPGPMAGAR